MNSEERRYKNEVLDCNPVQDEGVGKEATSEMAIVDVRTIRNIIDEARN